MLQVQALSGHKMSNKEWERYAELRMADRRILQTASPLAHLPHEMTAILRALSAGKQLGAQMQRRRFLM